MRRKRGLTRGEMKRRNKRIIISITLLLFLISVGYGAFQTTLNINVLGKIKVPTECVEGKVWEFTQKNVGQEFRVPCSGEYKVELWGAQGGGAYYSHGAFISNSEGYEKVGDYIDGGKGGYTSGKINLKMNKKIYMYVGGEGYDYSSIRYRDRPQGGYNGGGQGGYAYQIGAGGGGATDVRTSNSTWDDFFSLKSRIMVAGAGAGTSNWSFTVPGGAGGGLVGYNGKLNINSVSHTLATGGSQVSGGISGNQADTEGSFGIGADSNRGHGGGGGSGYYGGGGGGVISSGVSSGAGGSSFISGHEGCDAISEQSTEDNIIHIGQSIHYSGLYFTDTVVIDGAGYKWTDHKLEDLGVVGMPTHSGVGTMVGNKGDGFAKITLLIRRPN